jgi:hypothetical protein
MDSDSLFLVKQLFWQGKLVRELLMIHDVPAHQYCFSIPIGSYKGKRKVVITRNIHPDPSDDNSCFQSNTTACIQEATSAELADPTDLESLSRTLYAARSYLALSPPNLASALDIVGSALAANDPPASARAVKAFAEYLDAEDKSGNVEELRDLVLEYDAEEVNEDTREEERVVRSIAGTVFILEKEVEEAVTTLSEGCGKTDLEWYNTLLQKRLKADADHARLTIAPLFWFNSY